MGTLQAVAKFLKLAPGYLYDAHRCAKARAAKASPDQPNPSFVCGGKTCAAWFTEWLRRNPDFSPAEWRSAS